MRLFLNYYTLFFFFSSFFFTSFTNVSRLFVWLFNRWMWHFQIVSSMFAFMPTFYKPTTSTVLSFYCWNMDWKMQYVGFFLLDKRLTMSLCVSWCCIPTRAAEYDFLQSTHGTVYCECPLVEIVTGQYDIQVLQYIYGILLQQYVEWDLKRYHSRSKMLSQVHNL